MSEPHKIKVYRAILKRDVRTFSDMVTYASVEIGKYIKKTLIDEKGGKKPIWNEVLTFHTQQTTGKITVYDRNNFNDQIIGQGQFDIKNISETNETVIEIQYKAQVIGKIFVKLFSKSNPIVYPEVPAPSPTVSSNKQAPNNPNAFYNVANYMFQEPNLNPNLQRQQTPNKQKQINATTSAPKNEPQVSHNPYANLPIPNSGQPPSGTYLNPQQYNPYPHPMQMPTHMNIPAYVNPTYHPPNIVHAPYMNSYFPPPTQLQKNQNNVIVYNANNQRNTSMAKRHVTQQYDLLDQILGQKPSTGSFTDFF